MVGRRHLAMRGGPSVCSGAWTVAPSEVPGLRRRAAWRPSPSLCTLPVLMAFELPSDARAPSTGLSAGPDPLRLALFPPGRLLLLLA